MASPFHRYVGPGGDGRYMCSLRRDRQPEFDTIQLHGGQAPDTATNARAVPIYASTSFVFNDSAVSVFDSSGVLGLRRFCEAWRGSLWIEVSTRVSSAENAADFRVEPPAIFIPASETQQSYVFDSQAQVYWCIQTIMYRAFLKTVSLLLKVVSPQWQFHRDKQPNSSPSRRSQVLETTLCRREFRNCSIYRNTSYLLA